MYVLHLSPGLSLCPNRVIENYSSEVFKLAQTLLHCFKLKEYIILQIACIS